MADRGGPQVYSIAAHRGFADALVAGLIPRYAEDGLGLARLTLLLPSQRAARTVTEAFVRRVQGGLLLPRMAVVGDLDLDETLGALLDPLGAGVEIPPAADPLRRWLRLAAHLQAVKGDDAPRGAALLRQARAIGQTMDRLLVEGITPEDLLSDHVVGIVGELAAHWRDATVDFLKVQAHWLADLAERGEVDAPTRRNLLFDHAAGQWQASPPSAPIVAAGITSASPALARLLRVVSELPRGSVILPDLDLSMAAEVWEELGQAGQPLEPDGPVFGRDDAVTHPQYHLKLLLGRMGVNRGEVQAWHRSGLGAAPPARSRAISNLFLPPRASAGWATLDADQRRLANVRLMETAHPGEEAQAIAVLIRRALDEPEKRVALITPDRGLAARVVAHLRRWGIEADDSAGQPLPLTPAGRMVLLLAEIMAEEAAPVPLLAALGHPLARPGDERPAWLENVRRLDLRLRGPRPDAGLAPVGGLLTRKQDAGLAAWWAEVAAMLAPLLPEQRDLPFADALDRLNEVADALCGEGLWGRADGRAMASLLEDLREAAREAGIVLPVADLPAVLRDAMERVAVRPPWGGHPRLAIYGLLEARMARADLVICGALHEGSWPAAPAPDPLLPPAVLRALGVPGADFRIGLAAHDLAAALGAPEVVLSHAARDAGGPVIPSRFVARVRAMLGEELARHHAEVEAVDLARRIDDAQPAAPYVQPKPLPSPEQRRVEISATGLDRLLSDPYQFYAGKILQLARLDGVDAQPSPALQGEAVHAILDRWHKHGGDLKAIADEELDRLSAHPLMRKLWRPRLMKALEWVGAEIAKARGEGRAVAVTEAWGSIEVDGVRVHGRADRVDLLPDGKLAIVDYKTGQPPSGASVKAGYSLQLGTLGLIARDGGFAEKDGRRVQGEPERFEYWSMAKAKPKAGEDRKDLPFGYVDEPILDGRKRSGVPREEFLPHAEGFLRQAIADYINGSAPFTARLNPDIGGYNDYDQLMRLEEWQGRGDPRQGDEG